jgi:hypothetical protein
LNGHLARPSFDINHVIAYGQSLSSGWEGWPALSLRPQFNSLMLGNSVRPVHEDLPQWQPVGSVALQPLVATVQEIRSGALLSPEAVAALPQGSGALGETVLEGAVNAWRARLDAEPAFAMGQCALLASSCGVGGRTLEQLSRNAKPELFNRLRECATTAKAVAAGHGLTYGVVAILFLQGENNSWGLNGGTADSETYCRLLQAFYRDFVTDIAMGVAGQGEVPAMFMYQTGGAYASNDQAIAQAQLDTALRMPGCYMVAPSYPVTAKGGHLDANGYRWLGAQFGKVMHRVLTLREDWMPLHPRRASLNGQSVAVEFHVPVAPLRWGRPFANRRRVDVRDQGFAVVDSAGQVPLLSVEICGETRVEITLARPCVGGAVLRYAGREGHGGRGCLHDSDASVADDCYIYDDATGHDPSANIADLVGRPYPLMNWCVGFSLPLQS